jgi:hypothetical protein
MAGLLGEKLRFGDGITHPFHDELVERMGHPARWVVRIAQSSLGSQQPEKSTVEVRGLPSFPR